MEPAVCDVSAHHLREHLKSAAMGRPAARAFIAGDDVCVDAGVIFGRELWRRGDEAVTAAAQDSAMGRFFAVGEEVGLGAPGRTTPFAA